jgi:hypothetical protein
MGKPIPAMILGSEVVESAGCDVVKDFHLSKPFEDWKAAKSGKAAQKQKLGYEERVIQYLENRGTLSAPQELLLQEVTGKREYLWDAIERLSEAGVLVISGTKHSPVNPLMLKLQPDRIPMYRLGGIGLR